MPGSTARFTVRKISYGEGASASFPLYSPNVAEIEVIRRGDVRRAKLYYLRDRRGKSARIAEQDHRLFREAGRRQSAIPRRREEAEKKTDRLHKTSRRWLRRRTLFDKIWDVIWSTRQEDGTWSSL